MHKIFRVCNIYPSFAKRIFFPGESRTAEAGTPVKLGKEGFSLPPSRRRCKAAADTERPHKESYFFLAWTGQRTSQPGRPYFLRKFSVTASSTQARNMFLRPGRNLPPLFFPSSTKAHTYRIFRHSQRKSIKKGRKEIFPPCPQGQIKNSSKSWVEKGGG